MTIVIYFIHKDEEKLVFIRDFNHVKRKKTAKKKRKMTSVINLPKVKLSGFLFADVVLSLTLTQQSLLVVFLLLSLSVAFKPALSLFWVYSILIVSFVLAWTKLERWRTRPVPASSHRRALRFLGDAQRRLRKALRLPAAEDASPKPRDSLDLSLQLSMFLQAFLADFVDSWFVEIAADSALRDRIVLALRSVVDDATERISALRLERVVAKILRLYAVFLFQISEARRSFRSKSLFDSNRRLKRLRTLEEAFEINFGLHPVVRSAVSLGAVVSEKSPVKKTRRRSRRRSFLSAVNETPVSGYDYFRALFSVLVELEEARLPVSRLVRDALADIVAHNALMPIMPKITEPAFLYECVSDSLAPASKETLLSMLETEKTWSEMQASAVSGSDAPTLSPKPMDVSQDSLEISDSRQDSMMSSASSDGIFFSGASPPSDGYLGTDESPMVEGANDPSTEETAPENCMNLADLEIEIAVAPASPHFTFSQFQDYVDVSLSTSALTAFQEAALNDALKDIDAEGTGDDQDGDANPAHDVAVLPDSPPIDLVFGSPDQSSLEPEVKRTSMDSILEDHARSGPSSPDLSRQRKHSAWASCPDLATEAAPEVQMEASVATSQSEPRSSEDLVLDDYDCLSVAELPEDRPEHYRPHFFVPAPEETKPVSSTEPASSCLTSSLAEFDPSSADRLFLSVMIPDTILCRDPHSGLKFTLYAIHYSAVYPCGPGGALEPRVGIVKRRFREFLTLHERLENSNAFRYSLKEVKGPSKWSGNLPWTNLDKNLIESRRKSLENYLKSLVVLNDISCSQPLREFLAYDADPRIAFVSKAPSYSNMFRLDRFFTKGLKGSLEEVLTVQATTARSTSSSRRSRAKRKTKVVVAEEPSPTRPPSPDFSAESATNQRPKLSAPVFRGKELSASSSAVSTPRTRSPVPESGERSLLPAHLSPFAGVVTDEDLLKQGVLDLEFAAAARPSVDGLAPLHVPRGPRFRWGPRGKKEQDRRSRDFRQGGGKTPPSRALEKQCELYENRRAGRKPRRGVEAGDLDDFLFSNPVESDEEKFYDAIDEISAANKAEASLGSRTALIDATVDILCETTRGRPFWINHEALLAKFRLVFGEFFDESLNVELKELTTESRWAYYVGLARTTLWPEEEKPELRATVEETRRRAFDAVFGFLPRVLVELIGRSEVEACVDALLDSVANKNLNLHFFLTLIEMILEDLFPEVDFLARIKERLDGQ